MVLSDEAAGDIVTDDDDIRSLLGWRWNNPTVPTSVPGRTWRGAGRRPNRIDRAVWPPTFVHIEHEKLLYNQVIANPAT